MSSAEPEERARGRASGFDLPSLFLAAVMLVIGVTLAVDASRIESPPGGGAVGPAAFPWAIAVALIVLGLVLGIVATRGRPDEAVDPLHTRMEHELNAASEPDEEPSPSPEGTATGGATPLLSVRPLVRVAVFLAGLVLHALLIETAGYVVAALVLFVAVALAFGAPKLLRTVLVGAALTLVIFYSFTLGLGLALPNLGGR